MDDLPPAAPAKPKTSKLFYTGKFQDCVRTGIISLVLSVVTLGGYYAKANTDICTWLGNHLVFNKKIRVKYTGTTIDFAKIVVPVGLGCVLIAAIIQWSVMSQNYLVFLLMLPTLYGLIYYGFYAATHYRLNHLRLGGAPVRLLLPAKRYMMLFLKRAFFNLVTFGYAIPKSDLEKWSLCVSHIQIGASRVSYTGTPKNLFWSHLVSLGLPLILGLTFILMLGPVLTGDPAIDEARIAASQSILTFMLYTTAICGFLGRAWYQADLRAEYLRGLTCGNLRFKSTASGHDLFKLRLINGLILFVTLGLGLPVVWHRNLSFMARTIAIQGDIEELTLKP